MKLTDKNIAVVIPARANSERFPGKNLALLNRKPLIEYSLDFAKEQRVHFSSLDVFVSTNDPQVKEWARSVSVEVIDRPDPLSTPTSSSISVLQHASACIGNFDYMVLLQPTNPLRPADLMLKVLQQMEAEGMDSAFTVSPLYKKVGRLRGTSFIPQNYTFGQRSQDMEELYFENGLLYVASKEMIDGGVLMNTSSLAFNVEHPYAQVDIDFQEDLAFAERILALKI